MIKLDVLENKLLNENERQYLNKEIERYKKIIEEYKEMSQVPLAIESAFLDFIKPNAPEKENNNWVRKNNKWVLELSVVHWKDCRTEFVYEIVKETGINVSYDGDLSVPYAYPSTLRFFTLHPARYTLLSGLICVVSHVTISPEYSIVNCDTSVGASK